MARPRRKTYKAIGCLNARWQSVMGSCELQLEFSRAILKWIELSLRNDVGIRAGKVPPHQPVDFLRPLLPNPPMPRRFRGTAQSTMYVIRSDWLGDINVDAQRCLLGSRLLSGGDGKSLASCACNNWGGVGDSRNIGLQTLRFLPFWDLHPRLPHQPVPCAFKACFGYRPISTSRAAKGKARRMRWTAAKPN